jgi:hypothetical protein
MRLAGFLNQQRTRLAGMSLAATTQLDQVPLLFLRNEALRVHFVPPLMNSSLVGQADLTRCRNASRQAASTRILSTTRAHLAE